MDSIERKALRHQAKAAGHQCLVPKQNHVVPEQNIKVLRHDDDDEQHRLNALEYKSNVLRLWYNVVQPNDKAAKLEAKALQQNYFFAEINLKTSRSCVLDSQRGAKGEQIEKELSR